MPVVYCSNSLCDFYSKDNKGSCISEEISIDGGGLCLNASDFTEIGDFGEERRDN